METAVAVPIQGWTKLICKHHRHSRELSKWFFSGWNCTEIVTNWQISGL